MKTALQPGKRETIEIDKLGRICTHGKHFMRARDENTFPVRVYRKTTD